MHIRIGRHTHVTALLHVCAVDMDVHPEATRTGGRSPTVKRQQSAGLGALQYHDDERDHHGCDAQESNQ